MRIMKLSKELMLASCFGVGSFLVAHFAMSLPSPASPVQQDVGPVAGPTTVLQGDAPALPAYVGKTLKTTASYSTRKPLVLNDGDAVMIGASYTIRDTRPNLGYVWAIHVFLPDDADGKVVLFEKWFEGQAIEVNGDQAVAHVLFERLEIPLPPDSYRVVVGAYRVQPGARMAGLKAMSVGRLVKGLEGPSLGVIATIGL